MTADMNNRTKEQNTETGGHKAAEVSQPERAHLERAQPGVGHLSTEQSYFEMDDLDRKLMVQVRKALKYSKNGDPVKDVMGEDEMVEAMELLDAIVKARFAR